MLRIQPQTALGKFELSDLNPFSWSPCSVVRGIPAYKAIVQKFGCDAKGKALATDAINQYLSSNKDPTGFIGSMGSSIAIDCLCGSDTGPAGGGGGGGGMPWYAWAGIGVGVLGIASALIVSMKKPKTP